MTTYVKIPVIKNRNVVLKKRKQTSVWAKCMMIALILILTLISIWLKVETNLLLARIGSLERKLQKSRLHNANLRALEVNLSSYDRITGIAREKLGLIFLDNENSIKIPKE